MPNYTLPLTFRLSQAALWLAAHPSLARAALVILPLTAALVAALVAHNPAYACPASSTSCSTGG